MIIVALVTSCHQQALSFADLYQIVRSGRTGVLEQAQPHARINVKLASLIILSRDNNSNDRYKIIDSLPPLECASWLHQQEFALHAKSTIVASANQIRSICLNKALKYAVIIRPCKIAVHRAHIFYRSTLHQSLAIIFRSLFLALKRTAWQDLIVVMAAPDLLFAVRNYYYLGAYQHAISEASDLENLGEAEKVELDSFVYRSYIELGSYEVPRLWPHQHNVIASEQLSTFDMSFSPHELTLKVC
jgi:hypothetical protein